MVLVVLLGLGLLAGCERGVELDPPRPAASGQGDPGAGLGGLVADLGSALAAGDAQAAAALGTDGARPLLTAVVRNVRELRVTDVALRYLELDAAPGDAERRDLGDDVVAARVRLTFAYAGVDRRPATLESRVLVAKTNDGPRVAGLGGVSGSTPGAGAEAEDGRGTRTPLWFSTPLTVVRQGAVLLAVAGDGDGSADGAGRYPRLARTAVQQVREVLPRWSGPLVVEVPADGDQLDAVLAAPDGRYDAIAGVAATVDGSTERGAPVRVYLNPGVFSGLSRRGAQVVLTHEATHVAVGAPYADMPVWLLEGFADYVALAGDRVPVDVAARQVLQRVREDGPPDALPDAADLDPSAPGLGATYEEAWLACRYVADRFGQAALVELYDRVDAGTALPRAVQQVLGTSESDVVEGWRRDVAALAGVPG